MGDDWTDVLWPERFPGSATHDPEWIRQQRMGAKPLWSTAWPCEAMDLRPGMRVLDLCGGKAPSSSSLAKPFGVRVWATDLWIPTENPQ